MAPPHPARGIARNDPIDPIKADGAGTDRTGIAIAPVSAWRSPHRRVTGTATGPRRRRVPIVRATGHPNAETRRVGPVARSGGSRINATRRRLACPLGAAEIATIATDAAATVRVATDRGDGVIAIARGVTATGAVTRAHPTGGRGTAVVL